MLKSWNPSALYIPLLIIIVAQLGTTSASQNLSLKGLVRRDQPAILTSSRRDTLRPSSRLLTSTSSGRKRKKRRKPNGDSGVHNKVLPDRETKRTMTSAEDGGAAVVASLESTKSTKSTDERKQQEEKMPSLFMHPDELIYDKYAACLAATEGLRRTRDAMLDPNRSAVNINAKPAKSMVQFWKRGNKDTYKGSKVDYQRACAQYVLQSGKMVRSMGLSVSQFNQLGREVGIDKILKERVS